MTKSSVTVPFGGSANARSISGVAFAVLSGAAAAVAPVGDLPSYYSPARSVALWYAGHFEAVRVEAVLMTFALFFLTVWAAATVAAASRGTQVAATVFAVGATGFAVTFGLGGAAFPVAATLHASRAPATAIAATHDAAVAIVAISGLFGALLVAGGAVLCAGPGRLRTAVAALSVVAFVGELAAPLGLLTPSGPINPYDGGVTLVAAVVFLVWAALCALLQRDQRQEVNA